ncbi:hypothetical protein K443DRAFT_623219 [Laccaria amethystina LaAM-08-1]|uniref:Uncharacterized protein n=1 Tax=Laccaria amethystina LaAM-08-1 TaxID=1095629 RepID=A0A0C9WP82_9AGAR|nr:hypothetical protein K443DRAFT_623219 [Laccaria amethystina LaAM-08-1]
MSRKSLNIAVRVLTMFILAHPISGSITSAVCGWSGTAPLCNGGCSSGQTRLPSNSQRCGTGSCCWTGSKALCCTLPSCPSGFEWARNQVRVDPCFLASQISEACAPANQQEILISNGNSYAPPTANDATPCTCSSPLYFLASACAFCQGGSFSWKTWSAACTTIITTASGLTASTSGIPDLPLWSLLNVTNQPSFNATIAQDLADGIPVLATSTSTSTVMTTQTPSPGPSQSNNFKHLPTKSKSTIGAAVGGTIGGIALVAALLAVCLILCRRTSPQARSFEQAQAPDKGSSFRTLVNERPLTLSEVGDGAGSPMQGMDTA